MTLAVITGASGFLGRHVRAVLSEQEIETLGVSRQNGPSVDRSIRSYDLLEDAAVLGRPHQECALIHLAGEPQVGRYQDDENLAAAANELALVLSNLPWRRMIFASSGAVYKPVEAGAFLDESAAIAETPYATCKLAGEQCFLNQGGTVLRLTNLMGAGMSEETIISDILKQVSPEEEVEIVLRDCSAIVDLLLASDAAEAFRHALSFNGAVGKVLNIGSGGGVKARALAACIVERFGKRLVSTTSQNEEKHRGIVLNSDLAGELIDWRAGKSIEAAISTFIPMPETQ